MKTKNQKRKPHMEHQSKTDLEAANQELARSNTQLASELSAMSRLHELSSRLLVSKGFSAVLEEALSVIVELQSADFGNIRLYDPDTRALVIAAHRNFDQAFLDQYHTLTCGTAARRPRRVMIENIDSAAQFASYRAAIAALGIRTIQSIPLCGGDGELLGAVSTHFRAPHRSSEDELRLTDLYAQHAAEVIERKRADEERNKLVSVVENSFDFIGIATLSGTALFVNPAGRRLVGLNPHGPIPNNILDYLLGPERERVVAQVLPVVELQGRWDGETCFRNFTTGAMIPMLQHIFFILDPQSGRRIAMGTICRDITERKRAEQELGKAQDELAHATRILSLGEVTSSIAHEISQPLAAIIADTNAALRWIDRAVPDLPEARASLERVIRDSLRATDVIQRVKDLSTKTVVAPVPLNLNDTIRETLDLLGNELRRQRITVVTHQLERALSNVLGDRVQLQQVILNLIVNGIDAVRTGAGPKRELEIRSWNEPTVVQVQVRDSGGGVPREDLKRIFDPFFTTKPQGLGLGLSISRRILEAHGGHLRADSNAGHGMSMSFSLPRCDDQAVL